MNDNERQIEFNLLEEGWIRVLLPDCSVREVSLPDALLHSHEYVDLAGEMPTQDVAVLRLLLAVLHTVFSRVDVQGEPAAVQFAEEAVDRWKALWREGKFPEEPIRSYLNKWRDRFWLFHPDRPFWQVPEDKTATGYSAAKLNGEISKSGHKERLFSNRTGGVKDSMTYAEAARWLLALNGYDDASVKVSGQNRGSGIKFPATGVGWLGKIGVITASGDSLFETLMLNLTFCYNKRTIGGDNHPCWEEKIREDERVEIPVPNDFASLLTFQSRRIHLVKSNGLVTGYRAKGGDVFSEKNSFIETMTSWSISKNTYSPKRHDPSTQMWREFPSLFSYNESLDTRSGLVAWIALLQSKRIIDSRKLIKFKTVGVQYDGSNSSIVNIFSDSLLLSTAILSEFDRKWQQIIKDELERCEKAAYEVEVLAKRIDQAVGNDRSGLPKRAKEQYYDRLNQPFRLWLERIDPEKDDLYIDEAVEQWRGTARRIADVLGRELIQKAGPAAIVGREIKEESKGKKKAVFCSAPDAYNWFCYRISKIFE